MKVSRTWGSDGRVWTPRKTRSRTPAKHAAESAPRRALFRGIPASAEENRGHHGKGSVLVGNRFLFASSRVPFLTDHLMSGVALRFRSYLEWRKSMGYKRNLKKIIIIFIKSSQYYAILYTRGDKKNPAVCAFTTEGFLEQSDMVKCECR